MSVQAVGVKLPEFPELLSPENLLGNILGSNSQVNVLEAPGQSNIVRPYIQLGFTCQVSSNLAILLEVIFLPTRVVQ